MGQNYQKKSYALFLAWMAAFVIVMVLCGMRKPNLAGIGSIKTFCLLLYAMLDLLYLIIWLTESIYWISGVTYEDAAAAGKNARKRYAFRHLRIFLAASLLFLLYCIVSVYCVGQGLFSIRSSAVDSLVAGGLICIAAVLTIPIKLEKS